MPPSISHCNASGLITSTFFIRTRPIRKRHWSKHSRALEEIVQQGKARYVGLSHYPRAIFEQACRESRLSRHAPVIVHQATYNLLLREEEKELLEVTRATGAGFVVCSPLMEGLLSTKYLDGFPEESRGAKAWNDQQRGAVTNSLKEKIRKLNEIAKARAQTLPQMAIAWVLRHPEVTTALIGASDIDQIEQNVKALDNLKFSEDELRQIDEISAE